MKVKIDDIVIGDRIRTSDIKLDALVDSIRKVGLIQPVVINEKYQLLSGYRRLMACKDLGWSEIDVRMIPTEENQLNELEIELHENNGRVSLNQEDYLHYRELRERILTPKPKGFINRIQHLFHRLISFFKDIFNR
jgi:ParB family transcriptional regulator, chromosome partitioning protein